MKANKTFSGRIVFDHMAKTGGQALNAYLKNSLGYSQVTDNLIANYRDGIKIYGGEYSVISGHMTFDGNGLDPRYQHITCLREPISRAISWTLFVLMNHTPEQLPGLYETVNNFVVSNGENIDELQQYFCNPYIEHFSSIDFVANYSSLVSKKVDQLKYKIALNAIKRYDVIGVYENFNDYLVEVNTLCGLPSVSNIAKVNITKKNNAPIISSKLIEVLTERNQEDIKFYKDVMEFKKIETLSNENTNAKLVA